jgi:hypothetical protein
MATPTDPTLDLGAPFRSLDFDAAPVMFANHFLVQHQLNEFVVTLDQVTLARTGLTRDRMVELIGILQTTLLEHDRTTGSA